MPVRTSEELANRLDSDIAWRKRELFNIGALLASVREHQQRVLLRSAICILYAHWEGFMKNTALSYLEYVSTRRLRYQGLTLNFWALSLRNSFVSAGQTRRTSIHLSALESILSYGGSKFTKLTPDAIDTLSNLNSTVLSDMLSAVGVDAEPYLQYRVLLDERLLNNRNSIAHGSELLIDTQDYVELHGVVVSLMDRFKDDIQNAVAMRSYRS